ncbi:hypothetical protein [Hymenobacter sp. UYCo722]|uniref:hypothetical protein n=1 Tax=Hymenobacter sp. UYCo722 TaxID=3156335 RepID=UPI0033971264
MKPFPVLPAPGISCLVSWPAYGAEPISRSPLIVYACPAAAGPRFRPPGWATTAAASFHAPLLLVGPGEQTENQEEDEDDLELESDEDQSKLRIASTRPGTEEGSTAARGGDGTINPPVP